MVKTSINHLAHLDIKTNSAIELVQWPLSCSLTKSVMAMQTTRYFPILPHQNVAKQDIPKLNSSPYQAFNLGLHVRDTAKDVERNRNYLQSFLPKNTNIQWLEQVHGNHVVAIEQISKQAIVADAVITCEKNICLAIMTADCLPILLTSTQGNEIAAIHGGWRPLAANIIANTINKMQCDSSEICAWLGPCIGQSAFEVGSEVKAAFVALSDEFSSAFIAQDNGKYLADLQRIANLQLQLLGVSQVSSLTDCTFSNSEKYYSYRKNPTTGRMVSLICRL